MCVRDFITCVDLCNHPHSRDAEMFITTKPLNLLPPAPITNPWQPRTLFSIYMDLLIQECYIKEFISHVHM